MLEESTVSPKAAVKTADRLGRPLRHLRLSVTDRCDLRCRYCMPESDYVWLPQESLLRRDEIEGIVNCFLRLGANRIRLTGGEPLLRPDLPDVIRSLASRPGIEDLSLTTNGVRLPEEAERIREAGLHRLTVSLDTLKPERFVRLTGRDRLSRILAGLEIAAKAGFRRIKINMVVIRGVNDDECPGMIRFGGQIGAEVRLIEYMDVGGATQWSPAQVVSAGEILAGLERAFGPIEPVPSDETSPARRFRFADGTVFGLIASTTSPFCRDCDRSRLTADGRWYRCLYANDGLDLRGMIREGASPEKMTSAIARFWQDRTDRGAESRLEVPERGPLYAISELRRDPHLEMHTRGG